MGMFLTKEERQQFDYHGPTQNFDGSDYNIRDKNNIEWFDQGNEVSDVQKLGSEYSEADAKRIAAAITSFSEMGFKKFSKIFVLRVLDAAEESGLSVVAVLGCLEDFLKIQKATPTYSHFYELFEEAKQKMRKVWCMNDHFFSVFSMCADDVFRALTEEKLDEIRRYIPDFPDVVSLDTAWKKVFDSKYGVGTFYQLGPSMKFSKVMVRAIDKNYAWPVIELHQMWLADNAGEIPEEWDDKVEEIFKPLFQPDDVFLETVKLLEVHFQPDEPDTDEWGDDKF